VGGVIYPLGWPKGRATEVIFRYQVEGEKRQRVAQEGEGFDRHDDQARRTRGCKMGGEASGTNKKGGFS